MFRKLVAYVVAVTLTWSTWPMAALPQPQSNSTGEPVAEQVEERLDIEQFVALIEQLRSHIDRSQFDLEVLLEELDYDAERIIDFVRREIAFEQYPGLLRGALGTLMSRAGNALDQSVLLATLLKDAGYEGRINRGRLSPAQADDVLSQMQPTRPYPPAADFEALEKTLWGGREPPAVSRSSVDAAGWVPPSEEAIDRGVNSLRKALEAAGIDLGDPKATPRLRDEARDYFWVEVRLGASGWSSIQPIFAEAGQEFTDLSATEIFHDQIPAGIQHRLRFQAFIEQKVGEDLKVHATMEPWERPVANLLDRSISFANVPWGLAEETLEEPWPWEEGLEDAPLFLPFFAADLPRGARAFDRNGVPFSVVAMTMDGIGATALVQEVSDKFGKASGLLSGVGSSESGLPPDDFMALTGQWIEYTLIAPDGEERRYRRAILDRLGPAARALGNVSPLAPDHDYRALVARHTFRVSVGRTPPALLLDETLAELSRLTAGAATRSDPSGKSSTRLPEFASPEPFLLAVFEQLGAGDDRLLYRSAPGIVAWQSGLTAEDGVYLYGDIVRSPWRGFALEGESAPSPTPELVMRQGVWETGTEDYLLALTGLGNDQVTRPTKPESAGEPVVLAPGDGVVRVAARFGADVVALLDRDLQQDHAAVVSGDASLRRLNPLVAWWRIDPRTGETLGVGLDGRGPVATEWLLETSLVAALLGVSLACYAMACDEYYKCKDAPDPRCCTHRFTADRRKDLQKSFPGTLLVKWSDANLALIGERHYDPACLYEQ